MKKLTIRLTVWLFAITLLSSFTLYSTLRIKQQKTMKIAVWDTYVQKENGVVAHFDILVPDTLKDENIVYGFGKHYLDSKGIKSDSLTAKECKLCHIEEATESIIKDIEAKGYSIIEMENCN